MKLIIPILILAACCVACKDERFPEPEGVFAKWTGALKNLNYADYRTCEAYPKEEGVFRDMYRHTYYAHCSVKKFDGLDRDDVKKDKDGNTFLERKVWFECAEVRRDTGKEVGTVRGEVYFIQFTGGDKSGGGWLMWNRSMYRLDQ